MEEEHVSLIVDAVARGFQETEGQLSGLDVSFQALAQHVNQDASGALAAFGINLAALNNPLTAIATGLKDSMDTATHWGESVQKLAAASGESAEKASTMATVFGDFGINVDNLDRTIKAFTKNGLQFNLETMQSLAVQYQAIQDPVERDKFAFDNFGRSAMQMNEILNTSPDKLQAMANAAQYSGKVVGTDMVQSMEDARIKAAQLQDRIDGLKLSVGTMAVTVGTEAADSWKTLSEDLQLFIIKNATMTGQLSYSEAAIRAQAVAAGDLSGATDKLTDAQRAAWSAMLNVSDASDRAAAAKQNLLDVIPRVTEATKAELDINKEQLDYMLKNGDATEKAIDAYWKLVDAQKAAADKAVLSAGMAGTVTKAEAAYGAAVEADAPKLAKLNAELAKLEAAQGKTVTATLQGKMSQEDYQTLVDRTALALAKYNDALAGTGKHQKDANTIEGLRITWQNYANQLDDVSGKLQTSSTYVVDNSTAIGKLKAQIDPLIDAENKAKEAIDKATASLLFQAVSANLPVEAQTKIAFALGMVSKADYDLALAGEAARAQYDKNIKSGMDANQAANIFITTLGALKYSTELAAGVLPPMKGHLDDLGLAAHNAAKDLGDTKAGEDALYDKSIKLTVYTNHVDHWGGGTGLAGEHLASGGDFIVPAGYPNDSYPIQVQSGERVIVIPPGQPGNGAPGGPRGMGGGITINNHIHDQLAMALEHQRQRDLGVKRLEASMG